MTTSRDRKTEIVRAASRLFRRQGFAATGLSEILAEADTPKGSLYHHFPGGKEAIGAAALEYGGALVTDRIIAVCRDAPSAADAVRMMGRGFADWLARTDYAEGCMIATTVLETAHESGPIRDAGSAVFQAWRAPLSRRLERDGLDAGRAAGLAVFALSALEGAMILAKAERTPDHVVTAADDAAARIADVLATVSRRTESHV